MMQAVTPMRVNLNRFEDSMLFQINNRAAQKANVYAGLSGMSGLSGLSSLSGMGAAINWATYQPTPDDEATVSDANGNTIYTDWTTRRRYTYDDNGLVQWLGNPPTSGSSDSGLDFGGFFSQILGTATGQAQPYRLPDGTVVTTSTPPANAVKVSTQWINGVPNSFLVLGGAALVLMLMAGRR